MSDSTVLIVRGILSFLVGIIAIVWPGVTLVALVFLFGIYALLDGIVNIAMGLSRRFGHDRSWAQVGLGALGILAGILAFAMPGLTLFALILVIAAWAIVRGVLELIAAVRLRRVITGEWVLGLAGILSILFGAVVMLFPAAGAVGIAWALGVYAATIGILLIVLGIRLRKVLRAA